MSQQVKIYRTLEFWYGGDKTLYFDAETSSTIVYVKPKTDATEYLAFGDGTLNMDVKFFGGTGAAAYMLWDESADQLMLEGVDLQLNDSDILKFGDLAAGDITFNWDGSKFEMESAAAASTWNIGAASYLINILMGSTSKIQFLDTGIFIQSSADGKLLISSDGAGADDITLSGTVTTNASLTLGASLILNGQTLDAGAGNLTVSTTGSTLAQLTSTSAGADAAIYFQLNSATPANNDYIQFLFKLNNSTPTLTTFGMLVFRSTDVTATSEDAEFSIYLMLAGTNTLALTLTGAGVLTLPATGSADLGTNCEANAYTVGGTAGCDATYATTVTGITVVKGIVTAVTGT